jgi:hypothetical protein
MNINRKFQTVAVVTVSAAMLAAAPASAAGFYKPDLGIANPMVVLAADAARKRVMYRPPLRGAPSRRVGGATRGSTDANAVVAVLAPESTGLAGRADPTLYWYSESPIKNGVTFTLIADNVIDPIAELEIDGGGKAGLQAMSLSKRGVMLQPDVIYEWSVAVVIDADNRSKDIISTGTVMYRKPDGAAAGNDIAAYTGYLENGYWYDAVELVVGRMTAADGDAVWRDHYGDLLAQVGLDFVTAKN